MTIEIFNKFFNSSFDLKIQPRYSTCSLIPRVSKLITLLFIPFSGCVAIREKVNSREICLSTPDFDFFSLDKGVCSTFFNKETKLEDNNEIKSLKTQLELSKKLAEGLKLERDLAIEQLKDNTYWFNNLLVSYLTVVGLFFKLLYDNLGRIHNLNVTLDQIGGELEQIRREFVRVINELLYENRQTKRQQKFIENVGVPPDYLVVGNEKCCALCLNDYMFLSETESPAAASPATQPTTEIANLADDPEVITSHRALRSHIKKVGDMRGELCAIYCVTCIDKYFESGGNSCPSCSEQLEKDDYIELKIIPPKIFKIKIPAHFAPQS